MREKEGIVSELKFFFKTLYFSKHDFSYVVRWGLKDDDSHENTDIWNNVTFSKQTNSKKIPQVKVSFMDTDKKG